MIVEEAPAIDDNRPAHRCANRGPVHLPVDRPLSGDHRSVRAPEPLHGGHHHQILKDRSRVPTGRWIMGPQVCAISQEFRRQP